MINKVGRFFLAKGVKFVWLFQIPINCIILYWICGVFVMCINLYIIHKIAYKRTI